MDPFRQIKDATPVPNREFLKDPTIETRAQLVVVEAENVRKAHAKYLAVVPSERTAPFTDTWALRLHKEMLGKVWSFAGEVRTSDLCLGVPHYLIRQHLYELFHQDLPFWNADQSMPLMEVAARLHHRAVKTHPFLDGNGRWSRLLADIWIKQHGGPDIEWPTEITEEHHPKREEFIQAIKNGDNGDFALLLELQERYSTNASD